MTCSKYGAHIRVTKQTISQGTRNSPMTCPVALAINKVCIPMEDIICGTRAAVVSNWSAHIDGRAYKLPITVQARVWLYDKTGIMWPFEFEF